MLKEMHNKLLDRFSKGTEIKFLYAVLAVLVISEPVSCDVTAEVRKDYAIHVCNKNLGLGIFEAANGSFCCMCPSATHLSKACNIFEQQPDERLCEKCIFDFDDPDNQQFMPMQNNKTSCYKAHGKNYCDSFMNTHRVNGTTTRNSRCECKPGYHSANITGDVTGGCHKHSPCEEGFQPSHLATSESDTLCEICPNGTFSNVSSLTAQCIPFTICELDQNVTLGNSTHDTVCSMVFPINNTTASSSIAAEGLNSGFIFLIAVGVVMLSGCIIAIVFCYRKRLSGCIRRQTNNPDGRVVGGGGGGGGGGEGGVDAEPLVHRDDDLEMQDRRNSNGSAFPGVDPSKGRNERNGTAAGVPLLQGGNTDDTDTVPLRSSSNQQLQVDLSTQKQNEDEIPFIDGSEPTDASSEVRGTKDDDASTDTSQDSRAVSEKTVVETFGTDSEKKDEAGPMWDGSGTQRTQGRLEYSPYQNGLDGSTSSTHQPPEDSLDLAGGGEAAASDLPSGNGDNGQGQSTRSTTTGDQNANGQGDISSSDDHSGQVPSDPDIQRNYENGSEAKNESTPIPEEITPEQTMLSAYLNELDFFGKYEKNAIQNSGCDRRLLEEALETNHEIAKSMLRVLPENKGDEYVFGLCGQLGLREIDREDIDKEERHNGRPRVRSRCIEKVIQGQGRNLVPKLIFKLNFEKNAALKDTLFDKFIEELKSSVSNV